MKSSRNQPICDLSTNSTIEMLEMDVTHLPADNPNINSIEMPEEMFTALAEKMNAVTLSSFSRVSKALNRISNATPIPIYMTADETVVKPFSEVSKVFTDYKEKKRQYDKALANNKRCYCPDKGKRAIQATSVVSGIGCIAANSTSVMVAGPGCGAAGIITTIGGGIISAAFAFTGALYAMRLFRSCQEKTKCKIDQLESNPVVKPSIR